MKTTENQFEDAEYSTRAINVTSDVTRLQWLPREGFTEV